MKKLFIILISLAILQSCQTASFKFDEKTLYKGVDFKQGKWLLAEIDAPNNITEDIQTIAQEKINELLHENVTYITDDTSLMPLNISINPSKKELVRVKGVTNYDFLVYIKSVILKDEISSVSYSYNPNEKNNPSSRKRNITSTIVEIYDLNSADIIYSRKMNASVTKSKHQKNDVSFARGTKSLIIKSTKKIFKELKQWQRNNLK